VIYWQGKTTGGMAVVFDDKIRDKAIDRLFHAVLSLESIDECYRFFYDICTVQETRSLAQRLEVAEMLHKGKSYNDIVRATGASTATISRIKRFLDYGANGYRLVLDRMEKPDPTHPQE
jgi:TrpR-related protein YerC/YecD